AARETRDPHVNHPHRPGRNSNVRSPVAIAIYAGAAPPFWGAAPCARLRAPSPLRLAALLQHARVRAVELQLDLAAPARELAHLPAPARADAVDLAVHASELELQALDLEHVRTLGLATRFHDELGDQCAELGVVLGQAARRRVQVPAEMLRHATQATVAEVLTEVELGERLRTSTRAGDAEREKRALGTRAARCQRG